MLPSSSFLPIDTVLPDLREALTRHNRCLLVARPGAGKTTRAPLALLEDTPAESGRWLLLEPRRVAARLAATYMAEQLGEKVGATVGYRVRGESRVSADTRLEVVTQGVLTRMLQDDPLLEGVAGVIFDEFHERSLEADLGLALALEVQEEIRPDLKLLVMSATLDVEALLEVLGRDTPAIDCPGRTWPVTTRHRPPPPREKPETHQARLVREALAAHAGNVLVFLPGMAEIRRLQGALDSLPGNGEVIPLHGQLSLDQQRAALRPGRERRVILATAIAESSLTVPGVRVVIDAGRERVPVFQPRTGLTRLETRQVNRASADQRRGRAGREAEGFCYRLWPQEQPLAAHREPEIRQADLAGLAFELARWGVTEAERLSWVTPPPAGALASARQLLQTLGILEENLSLTATGRRCARWPAHPRLAALLETAADMGCLPLACWLAAWLEESPGGQDPDLHSVVQRRPERDGPGPEGRWYRTARQWAARAGCTLSVDDPSPAAALLARAYPDRIAANQGNGRFKLVTGNQALTPETSALARSDWLVAVELDGRAEGARIYYGIPIDREALEALFPQTLEWRQDIRWDDSAGRLVGEEVRGPGPLVMARRPLRQLPADAVERALLAAVRERGHLAWGEQDRQLLGRLRLLRAVLGEPWPTVTEAHLLATLETWLAPRFQGLTKLADLDHLPLGQYLLDQLDWSLRQRLDELAPTHITVPSGSRVRIDYSGDEPVLAVKLQELFGQTETPRVAGGRVPVLIHLLSPARRPVQVTRDLENFWRTTYFEVRKDLKGRYPKHPWPDDPLQAQATRHTNRKART